ncbi:hypothetical protein J5J83_06750 [Azoarcus sp. L1K30]|uniref:type II secretion system protein N n=1 Tax=Azoarcus sp. L1K30 TaxID=2820277 RepID=UPI001B81F554|nr:type II secretion system protein N [Azoarcus sp. L1K30]MBR0565811.1 hypothetical protein [Azoarcus sp. L1K30]
MMISIPVRRLNAGLTLLAWSVAIGFAAWTLASIFWQVATPASVASLPRHQTDPGLAARDILRMLGDERHATPADVAVDSAGYRLVGLATGFGSLPGFALLQKDGERARAVVMNETLPDGMRLTRILPDRVELAGMGRSIELRMIASSSDAASRAASTTAD